MKKKLVLSMLATLIFGMFIITSLFIYIENYQYKENIKQILKANNNILINVLKNEKIQNKQEFFKENFKNEPIRETFIDKNGKVLSDSVANPESMDNHNGRIEVQDARKYGDGYSVRHSFTLGQETLYFATQFDDGYIVRSSITVQAIRGIESKYLKYYAAVIILSIGLSLLFASKLSQSIVKPVENLEYTTSRIAQGELYSRVKLYSNDEIGQLGKTFNNMADKLQDTIKDSLVKQNNLEAILRSMDSGVIAIDKNNKIIMMNPYAKRIFGINRDIIGEKLMDNIRDFELEDIFNNNHDIYKELKILWPKERELRIRTTDIISGNEKMGTVAVVNDITDIKRLENMRSQFVTNVSHELKTPLTSIKGFAETLRFVDDPVNKEKFLNIIDDETDRLTRLINDILTLSNIENDVDEKTEVIKINDIVKDVCYLMKNTANKKNIELIICAEEVPNLLGNSDRFKQMLINLVDNAIKYTDHNGEVKISTKYEGSEYIISVEDTGVGIPKEHIDRLFERFYRVDKARSRAQGGTGLGLAIVKHIVMAFNGAIEIESEVGKGSKFTIKIPREV